MARCTMTAMEMTTHSLEETYAFAEHYVKSLERVQGAATVLGLSGELGSGKTVFAKGVAKALGVLETVTSPTFVIEKIYRLEGQLFDRLVHIDAYRLEDGEELKQLGFTELLSDERNLIVVEWPERVSGILPTTITTVSFVFIDDFTRTIRIGNGKSI